MKYWNYKYVVTLFLIGTISQSLFAQVSNRLNFNDHDLFLNGGNIAWVNFASDIGPGQTNLNAFEEIFREVNLNGGNTMRLWLHTNGTVTPAWNGSEVSGPGEGAIEDLTAILDLAHNYDIGLMLCLWSFDMLQNGLSATQMDRNKGILTNSARLQTYIDNALIPMVDSLKGHPAINAWEIFNEPEGMSNEFGWLANKVDMSDIQWFINRTAGAIKRTDPEAKVTNGSWNIRASTDIFTSSSINKNYYSDEELISAGGDEDGTLDYYTVHYYKHFPTQQSPFHNDASHWELDKPIVVAEFYLGDGRGDGKPDEIHGVPWQDLYEELYERGYAGSLGWQWYDWYEDRTDIDGVDGTLSWPRMLDNMQRLSQKYSSDILFTYPGIRINFNTTRDEIEEGQETTIQWSVRGAEIVTLNGEAVAEEDERMVSPMDTTVYTIAATDTAGNTDSASVTIYVLDPDQINRAFQQPARASSVESEADGVNNSSANDPAFAVDGDFNTRWSSAWDDDEWIYVDLGETHDIHTVELDWEAAFAEKYTIDISFDGQNWEPVFTEEDGNGGADSVGFESPHATKFVRMHGITRATTFGFSLYEIEVRGLISNTQAPELAIVHPASGKTVEVGSSVDVLAEASDANGEIEYVSFFFDGDSLTTLNEVPYQFTIEDIQAGDFELYAKAADNEGIVVQSEPVMITGSDDFTRIRYEAEDANLTGAITIASSVSGASNDAYVNMEDSGTITWTGMGWPEAEEYQLSIGYYLPFDPKDQILSVNGEEIATITFNAPTEQWLTFDTTFTHPGGIDEFSIGHSWGYMYFDYVEISGEGVSVANENEAQIPQKLHLSQNYPNPFNPTTYISYELPLTGLVELKIYNVLGQEVATLINQQQKAGRHQAIFDAYRHSSGIYMYRLKSASGIQTKKMTLIK
ncbi:MAG: discoidin domain-containing protein [Balneolaceae bacterium]